MPSLPVEMPDAVPYDNTQREQAMADSKENGSAADTSLRTSRTFYSVRDLSNIGAIIKRVVHTWPTDEEVRRSGKKPYSVEAPRSLDHLEFEPKPMVGWYRPSELIKAGIEAVISSLFGSYADKRDVESVLTQEAWHDYAEYLDEHDELWIDYVADLGDGWDSTYTIARLLAEPTLTLTHTDKKTGKESTYPTTRGRVLVMGGDEVYPTAKREEYENRMIHPYRCAFPFVEYPEQAPHLYLIPGNHDWYDGLNSFFKNFCQEGWVGAWKTWQRRSYFALRLDEKLWLWGIDIQLNANIDQPQLDFFKHIGKEVMDKGSRIILCTAEPSWVYADAKTKAAAQKAKRARRPDTLEKYAMLWEKQKAEIYHNLGHLEKWTIKPFEHEVVVGLAGDWHNYTRYEAKDGSTHQRFVSGGGGAYLFPTHNMPADLKLPVKFGGAEYGRKAVFPEEDASKRLARRSLFFSFFPLNWKFTAFLGAFYLLLAWIVQSVSKVTAGDTPGATLLDHFREAFDLALFMRIIAHSPGSVVFLTVLVAGLMAFTDFESWPKKIIHGGLHALAHIALFLGLIRLFAWFNLEILADIPIPGWGMDNPAQVLLFGFEMLLFGGFLGGVVFGLYLWISNRFLDIHTNEVLLCQSHPDYKNFLRLHIRRDGPITIYPIGVKRVNRKQKWTFNFLERRLAAWALQPAAKGGAAWFEPKDGMIQDFAHLIEKPITIPWSGVPDATPAEQQADAVA